MGAAPSSPVAQAAFCLPDQCHLLPRAAFDDSKGLLAIEVRRWLGTQG